jgi:hypothetical protein
MVTYETEIKVYLGDPTKSPMIGTIHTITDEGFYDERAYYLPFGYGRDETTKIHASVAECKAALELEAD